MWHIGEQEAVPTIALLQQVELMVFLQGLEGVFLMLF